MGSVFLWTFQLVYTILPMLIVIGMAVQSFLFVDGVRVSLHGAVDTALKHAVSLLPMAGANFIVKILSCLLGKAWGQPAPKPQFQPLNSSPPKFEQQEPFKGQGFPWAEIFTSFQPWVLAYLAGQYFN